MELGFQKIMQYKRLSPEPYIQEDGDVIIYLFEEITEESTNRVIGEILQHEGKQIILKLKSSGGGLEDSLALVDVINEQNVQVNGMGYLFSGALLVFCGATIRTATPNTRFMYHDMAYIIAEKLAGHEQVLEEMKKVQAKYHKVITDASKIKRKTLQYYDNNKQDWYFDYEEAMKLGLLTHILTKTVIKVPKETVEIPASIQLVSEYIEYADYVKQEKIKQKVKKNVNIHKGKTTEQKEDKDSKG